MPTTCGRSGPAINQCPPASKASQVGHLFYRRPTLLFPNSPHNTDPACRGRISYYHSVLAYPASSPLSLSFRCLCLVNSPLGPPRNAVNRSHPSHRPFCDLLDLVTYTTTTTTTSTPAAFPPQARCRLRLPTVLILHPSTCVCPCLSSRPTHISLMFAHQCQVDHITK